MTETQARSALHSAQTKMETALTEYNQARAALQRITGEVHAVDTATAMKFTQAAGAATGHIQADC